MSTPGKQESRWREIVGLVAVVVSVLLLAWEIRQNTQTATAQAMLDLNAMANEVLGAEAQNAQLAAVLVKGEQDLASLSPTEDRQFRSHVYTLINAIDAAHGFFVEGILDEEDFSGWRIHVPVSGWPLRQRHMGIAQAHVGERVRRLRTGDLRPLREVSNRHEDQSVNAMGATGDIGDGRRPD